MIVIVLLLFTALASIDSVAADEKVENAVWGEWTVNTPCTSDCGACGRIHLIRDCLCEGKKDCPCSDRQTRVEVCATDLCKWPRPTCCSGFKKIFTFRGFKCGAENGSERVCEGQWTHWTPDSAPGACSNTCGMCGQRRVATRKCEPEGCECTGTDKELFEPCSATPCKTGRACCEGFVKGLHNGREECLPAPHARSLPPAAQKFFDKRREKDQKELLKRKAQFTPILSILDSPSSCKWGEWVEVDSECSSSCGMCGVKIAARRSCTPIGCNCTGSSVRYEDCGDGVCSNKERPCCGSFTVSNTTGVPTCIDAVADVRENRPARRPLVRSAATTTAPHRNNLSTSTCRGVWSPFSPISSSICDHACGMCGNRVVAERKCIPDGCHCEGSSKLYEKCGEKPCWSANQQCCTGSSIVLVDGLRICKEND